MTVLLSSFFNVNALSSKPIHLLKTNRMKRILFIIPFITVLLTQCKPEEQKVSKEEVSNFVSEIETGVIKRRPDIIASNIIIQALTDRMLKEKNIKNMSGISEGIKKGLTNSEFDKSIYNIIGKKGSFEKVKVYEKDGKQRVIFRIHGDNGLNYLDMELTKLENKVGIADMFIYMSGENISKTMAEFISRLTDNISEEKAQEAMEAFDGVKRLMAKGNYTQAKKELDRLPMTIRNTRIADVLDMQITAYLEEDKYLKAIEHFELKYANEPSVQLSMIDLYAVQKDYDKALHSINVLDSLIDKDSFLDYYRGLISYAKGDTDKAINYYKAVIETHPKFTNPYEQLITQYIIEGDMQNAKLYFSKYKILPQSDDATITSLEQLYPSLKE